jgi:hypothetical protein
MQLERRRWIVICASTLVVATMSSLAVADDPPKGPSDVYGPRIKPSSKEITRYMARRRSSAAADALRYWNQLAVDATGLDHTGFFLRNAKTFSTRALNFAVFGP